MPTNTRKDPYRNFRFVVEMDGKEVAAFSDASGFDVSVNMAEYREGNETTTTRKLPGLSKYGNITLKRGVTDDDVLYNWAIDIPSTGKCTRKSISIKLMDEENKASVIWQVINAWPTKYSITEFKGQGNEVLFESLEIAHEGMTRKKA